MHIFWSIRSGIMEMRTTEPHHNVDTKRCYIHLFSLEAYSDECTIGQYVYKKKHPLVFGEKEKNT